MNYNERNRLICQRREAGMTYAAIATEMGMTTPAVRTALMRELERGHVTAEQIGYQPRPGTGRSLPDQEYDARYLEKLDAKSRPGANGCIEVPDVFHNADGYAIVHHRSLGQFAHRVVTILKKGPIPPGKMACHDCGNHGCVNEDHLYIGTMKQNARDTVNHGRHLEANKTHCIHGHPFDEENTRVCKKGKRHCKTCEKIVAKKPSVVAWRREYQAKRRALKRANKLGEVSP